MKVNNTAQIIAAAVCVLALSACAKPSTTVLTTPEAQASPTGAILVTDSSPTSPQVTATFEVTPTAPPDSNSTPSANGNAQSLNRPAWEYVVVNLVTCPLLDKPTDSRNAVLTDDAVGTLSHDLQGVNLKNANLAGVVLDSVNLRGADLRNVNFQKASLRGADLRDAQLSGAVFNRYVPNVVYDAADLTRANLAGLDLSGLDLRDVSLAYADLSGANLSGTVFSTYEHGYYDHANLNRAILKNVTMDSQTVINEKYRRIAQLQTDSKGLSVMIDFDLSGADLRGVDLSQVDLKGANLSNADLRGVKLEGANLESANLALADLRGADLSGARLDEADLRYADVDETTKLDPKWLLVWQIKNSKLSEADATAPSDSEGSADLDLVERISLAAMLGTDCLNDNVGFFRDTDQITELNRLGKQGWEVVSIRRLYSENLYEGVEVYLKRVLD